MNAPRLTTLVQGGG
ncbi:Selenide,water dikinase [Minicystis rosea]|nr:Selenide,water dikinase [Minicystis rosea]